MNKFAKTRIALAIGAALMVMAGGVYAAAGDVPTKRAAAPFLGSLQTVNEANALALHSTAGSTAVVELKLNFAATSGATQLLMMRDAGGMAGTTDPIFNNATPANNDVFIYTLVGAVKTQFPVAGITAGATNWTTAGAVTQSVSYYLTAQGAGKLRINGGKLQYSSTGVVADFAEVKVDLQKTTAYFCVEDATTAAICDGLATTVVDSGAIAALGILDTAISLHSSVVPQPVVATRAKPTAPTLIDGVTVSTFQPLAVPVAANIAVSSVAVGGTDVTLAGLIPDAKLTIQAAAANSTSNNTITALGSTATNPMFEVFFTDGALVPWTTTATAAADAAAYNSKGFNTGVSGTAPFAVETEGTFPVYTAVFNAAGVAANLVASGTARSDGNIPMAARAAYVDGTNPAIVSAVSSIFPVATTTSKLDLTFSEPLRFIAGASTTVAGQTSAHNTDLREIAESVKLGTDALAALNLNAGGALAVSGAVTTGQQGVLSITGILTSDITGKQVSVAQSISVKDNNDAGFSATVAAVDDAGLKSNNLVTPEFLSAAATTIAAPTLDVAFGRDTTASVPTTVADATKVGAVVVKFAAGKEVELATGKTLTDLANNLLVTIHGKTAAKTPAQFLYHPVLADLGAGIASNNTFTIALPTALIYNNMNSVDRVVVHYAASATASTITPDTSFTAETVGAGGIGNTFTVPAFTGVAGNVLVAKAPNTAVIVDDGIEQATLPLSALATTKTLLTQNVQGTLTGASNGSLVRAWLAKWRENPATPSTNPISSVSITGGKVSRAKDDVVNQLAIEFVDRGTLEGLITTQQNKAAVAASPLIPGVKDAVTAGKAAPILVYATMHRSNDTRSNALCAGGTAGDTCEDILRGTVKLASTLAGATGARTVAGDDPVYELTLDPITGKLTGALTGDLTLKVTKAVTDPGLTLIDGDPVAAGIQPVAEGLVDAAGKFNLLAGVDNVTTEDLNKGLGAFTDQFLILVHEDQTNTRKFTQLTSANPADVTHLPFAPNLASKLGTRTVLGVAPGIAGTAAAAGPVNIDLAKYKVIDVDLNVKNWSIRTPTSPAFVAVPPPSASFARGQVGIDPANGRPISSWTADGVVDPDAGADMAMTMKNSAVFLATELGFKKGTLSTITSASFTPGAAAIAFKSDGFPAQSVTFSAAQGATVSPAVGIGWSLVTVPTGGTFAAAVDAIIRVGAQAATQFTWLKADGAQPAMTSGEGVFVFSKAGGKL